MLIVAALIETWIDQTQKEFELTINLNFSIICIAIWSPWSLRFSKFA